MHSFESVFLGGFIVGALFVLLVDAIRGLLK